MLDNVGSSFVATYESNVTISLNLEEKIKTGCLLHEEIFDLFQSYFNHVVTLKNEMTL